MIVDGESGSEPLGSIATLEPRSVRLASALGLREAGRVLRDWVTLLPTQVIPAIAGFLVLPILARQLAPTELGVLAIAQTLITLGWVVSAQWLTTALLRELPSSREQGALGGFSQSLLRGLGLTGVALGAFSLLLATASFFSSAVAKNLWLIIAAALGLVLQNIAVSLFNASLRPRAYAIVDVLARTGGIGLGVWLVFEGHKVHGYLLGLAVSSLVVGTVGLVAGWPQPQPGDPPSRAPDLRAWLHYGAPYATAGVAFWGLQLIDRYLLAALRDTGSVGVYSVGAVIGEKGILIPTFAFAVAARPLLITAFERHGRAEVERLMRAYSRIVLLVGLPVVALAAATAHVLIPLLSSGYYQRFYAPAAPVVPIVAAGSLIYAVSRVGETGLLVVAKQTRPLVYAALFALVVNVVANLVLIPPFGIKGAAIATPISYLALLLGVQWYARHHATWRFPYMTLVRGGLAAGAGYAAARFALTGVDGRVLKLAVAAAACVVAYAVSLALLGERRGGEARASA